MLRNNSLGVCTLVQQPFLRGYTFEIRTEKRQERNNDHKKAKINLTYISYTDTIKM